METAIDRPIPPFRYGDVPDFFRDAEPDAEINIRSPVTLARLLTRGRAEIIGKLVPLEVLQERREALPLPEHARIFWRAVLRIEPGTAPRLLDPGPAVG